MVVPTAKTWERLDPKPHAKDQESHMFMGYESRLDDASVFLAAPSCACGKVKSGWTQDPEQLT